MLVMEFLENSRTTKWPQNGADLPTAAQGWESTARAECWKCPSTLPDGGGGLRAAVKIIIISHTTQSSPWSLEPIK